MAVQILMPALSPTMTEGKLGKWLKKEGDSIKSGDVIAEIETDKATMEFEAVDEGTLGKILVAEGAEGVAVNTPIAVLLQNGESKDAIAAVQAKAPAAPATLPSAPVAPPQQTPAQAPPQAAAGPAPAPAPEEKVYAKTVKQTVREALRDAMAEEMRRDPSVLLLGE